MDIICPKYETGASCLDFDVFEMTTISVLEYLSLIGTMISIDRPHLTPTSGLQYMEVAIHRSLSSRLCI